MVLRHLILSCIALGCLSACSPQQSTPIEYQAEVFNAEWNTGEYFPELKAFFLAGEQGSITYSEDGIHWKYSDTNATKALHSLALDATGRTLIAVGDGATILRSQDNGNTWQPASISPPESVDLAKTRLNTVIFDAKNNSWLTAGEHNAILQSLDQGKNWTLVSYNENESTQKEILDLHIEALTGDVLFAAQSGLLGRSTDGGTNWLITELDMQAAGMYIPHLVAFYQFDDVLIAAADSGRLQVSYDNGDSWQLKKIPTAGYFTGSALDSKNNVIALSTQMGEIALSYDRGKNWKLISFSVNNWPSDDIPLLRDIHYDSATGSFVVLGNSGVIARSGDGGQSWYADIFKPLFNMSVNTFLHNPTNNSFVAAGLGGVIVSASKLSSPETPLTNWSTVRPGIDQYIRKVIHLPGTNIFVAVGQLGGIWRSTDDGINWQNITVDYPFKMQPPHLRDIVFDKESGALIAAGPAGAIIRSEDKGESWQSVYQGEFQKGEAFTQIVYDRKNKAYLASEVLYRTVFRSSDAGLNWQKYASFDSKERNLWHTAISEPLGLMMLVGERGGIAVSTDDGKNWSMSELSIENNLYGAYADDKQPLLLAVGEYGKILRSENGSDWQTIEGPSDNTLRRVFKDPKSKAHIAFGQNGTVLRSTDLGKSWQKANTPKGLEELRQALIEKKSGALLLLGRKGALLRSTDGGQHWNAVNSHTTQHLRSAAINPKTSTLIAVGEGLIRLTAPGEK